MKLRLARKKKGGKPKPPKGQKQAQKLEAGVSALRVRPAPSWPWYVGVLFFATLGSFFLVRSLPPALQMLALVSGLVLVALMRMLQRFWENFYLRFALPVNGEEKVHLRQHFQDFLRGQHGSAFVVRNGIPLETYRPKAGAQRPKLVLVDGRSALVYSLADRIHVLGPDVHFLRPEVTLKVFVDLREHRLSIPKEETEATLKDRTPIRATLFLIVHLEDFSIPEDWTPKRVRKAHALWESIYGLPMEEIQKRRFRNLLGFGHPLSVERAYRFTPVEQSQLHWWAPARDKAIQVWRELVSKHSLDELFPPAWTILKSPQQATRFEQLKQKFSDMFTQPGEPAFEELARMGIRVRAAAIASVFLDEIAERTLYQGFLNPLYQYYQRKQERMQRMFQHHLWLGRVRAQVEWLLYMARMLQREDTYPHLVHLLEVIQQGTPHSLAFEESEPALRELTRLMLYALEQQSRRFLLDAQERDRLESLLSRVEEA